MSIMVNRKTTQIIRLAHTPDYPVKDWLKNPEFPECEEKYYKVVGDEVLEMTAGEKATKDAEIAAQEKEARKEGLISLKQREVSREEAITALKADGVLDANGDLIE